MKFLKVYTDVITGSMAGRNDGYPCTKYVVYDNIEQLSKNHGTKADEKYYNLEEIDPENLANEVALIKKELEEKRKQEVIANKERQYEMLKKELGK